MKLKKSKVLVLVEGAKTDVALMQHLFAVYGIGETHTIVSYNTDIYTLYDSLFFEDDPDAVDLLQALKAREKDEKIKKIFDDKYSDILLIFDFDPHATTFSDQKIRKMIAYFTESSDMGKLYLNYPMVESFYHMKSIPDPGYDDSYATLDELKYRAYKTRVNRECFTGDYRKFAAAKEECSIVIRQNISKAMTLLGDLKSRLIPPKSLNILDFQLEQLHSQQKVYILSTCCFYIYDYNPLFLE